MRQVFDASNSAEHEKFSHDSRVARDASGRAVAQLGDVTRDRRVEAEAEGEVGRREVGAADERGETLERVAGTGLLLEDDGALRELHRDTGQLPESRGCPTTYRIYGVLARPDTGTLDDAVAIVSVYPFGFEGPDRRFLAVPLGE